MIKLRPYQEEGLKAIWQYYEQGNTGNCVISWPTGTGKSIVPAMFINEVMKLWPSQRFLVITHVKELIKQNFDVMMKIWSTAPAGIYSAGLKQRDIQLPIIFGGIQSMYRVAQRFGHRDIIFIDEAHLVNDHDSSMYLEFLAVMKLINPYVKIIGMSATPFRMGMGYITEGKIFTHIVHDCTGLQKFNELLEQGYLSPLIPKRTKTELDVSNVSIQNGDYVGSSLQKAVDKNEITYAGLREVVEYGQGRQSWLLFASGIEHSEHIAEMLTTFGVQAAAVHSKQKAEYNDQSIEDFKSGRLQAIVNFGKLTTGFNHPAIDLIGMFRPTLSIPLWVQMLGRGTRPAEYKNNCLVLDFAKNTPRLGPINDPIIPKKKGEGTGDAPVKICEECGVYNHAAARFCINCNAEFHFKIKIVKTSGTEELIKSDKPIIEVFEIERAIYAEKRARNGLPYIRTTYYTRGGMQAFNENVFPEHGGLLRQKFKMWWQQRHKIEPPATARDALKLISELRVPRKITVHVNKEYPEVVGCEY